VPFESGHSAARSIARRKQKTKRNREPAIKSLRMNWKNEGEGAGKAGRSSGELIILSDT
jgi:hypothetical protein